MLPNVPSKKLPLKFSFWGHRVECQHGDKNRLAFAIIQVQLRWLIRFGIARNDLCFESYCLGTEGGTGEVLAAADQMQNLTFPFVPLELSLRPSIQRCLYWTLLLPPCSVRLLPLRKDLVACCTFWWLWPAISDRFLSPSLKKKTNTFNLSFASFWLTELFFYLFVV